MLPMGSDGRQGAPRLRPTIPGVDTRGVDPASYPLTTDLSDERNYPYFLWDHPMTVAEFRRKLATLSEPERLRLLGKLLREARDTDVWRFTTPHQVWAAFDKLRPHLGRRRGFWEHLFRLWREEGLLGA